jgi:O-antigen biosynthesis protein
MLSVARKSDERDNPIHLPTAKYRLLRGDYSETATAKLLHLVGTGKRVLAVGAADDAVAQALHQQGCEVIRPDADNAGNLMEQGELALPADTEAASFDVVLVVGLLEQLRDPLTALQALKKFLRREGYLVAVVPNVAHGNIRLALLAGRFPSGDAADFRETPVRFFTYDSFVALLEDAEFAVGVVERQEEDINLPDTLADTTAPELLDSVLQAPEARTAQFITLAYPLPWRGLGWLQHRLRILAEQHTEARSEAHDLRDDLEAVNNHVRLLVEQQEASIRREKELRAQVLAGHDQLLRRDEEYRHASTDWHNQLQHAQAALHHTNTALQQAQAAWQHANGELLHRDHIIQELIAQRADLSARLERIRRSLPGRILRLARKLYHRARHALIK